MVETLPECSLPLTLLPAGLLEGQGSSRDGCCSQHTVSNASVRVTSLPLTPLPAGLLEGQGTQAWEQQRWPLLPAHCLQCLCQEKVDCRRV